MMKKLFSTFLLLPFFPQAQCFSFNAPNFSKDADVITFSSKAGGYAAWIYTLPVSSVPMPPAMQNTASRAISQNKVFTVSGYTGTAIQVALDSANAQGGGEVYAPDGVYLIGIVLTIGSNTKLVLAPNAVFKRNASINSMLINKHNGATGGYGQATNIEITGGVWDLNKANFPTNVTGIATGHASCIYIHDTKMINCYGWHFIELNATQHVIVKNVVLQDLEAPSGGKEMIQLDLMKSSGPFPWFGPYDNTPCDNVLIESCLFINGINAIGSHSSTLNYWHTNIKITNCHFITMRRGAAISMMDYQNVTVSNNTFIDCYDGIYASTLAMQPCKGYTITGNIMKNIQSKGIYLTGRNTGSRYMKDIILSNNTVTDCGKHGIGTDYCEQVNVTNNQVHNNGGTGIWLYRSAEVIANNNICFNNNSQKAGTGDLAIGSSSGVPSDTQDVLLCGNQAGTVTFYYGATNRIIFTNNIITSQLATSGTKASHKVFNNYIAGAWAF